RSWSTHQSDRASTLSLVPHLYWAATRTRVPPGASRWTAVRSQPRRPYASAAGNAVRTARERPRTRAITLQKAYTAIVSPRCTCVPEGGSSWNTLPEEPPPRILRTLTLSPAPSSVLRAWPTGVPVAISGTLTVSEPLDTVIVTVCPFSSCEPPPGSCEIT